ncbi:MAG: hypothetical protein AAF648_04215 [Pseudomonadota bacterium]
MSLVARELEAHGIATVVLGSALDTVEYCGVPRFVFTDVPLGNPCGQPYDRAMQRANLGLALELLATATYPRTTLWSPYAFPGGDRWRANYARVDDSNRESLKAAGEARRARQHSGSK